MISGRCGGKSSVGCMSQTRTMSLVEIGVGTLVKYLWATFLWHYVVGPVFNLPVNYGDSFLITFIFMVNGMVIAWLFRRWFNRYE